MKQSVSIISLQITIVTFTEALLYVMDLGRNYISSYICFANAHMVIEAHKNAEFACQVNNANLVLADGSPIAKACSTLYAKSQERIAGMDFLPRLLELLNNETHESFRIFFYGGSEETLRSINQILEREYPNLIFAGALSPPFRLLSTKEQQENIEVINKSSPNIVFVALGCPKQEKWMYENYLKIKAPLLGIGGALNVLAGSQKRAPVWMQHASLEWLYRLIQEPSRLFKRYLFTNTQFIWLLIEKRLEKFFYGQVKKIKNDRLVKK